METIKFLINKVLPMAQHGIEADIAQVKRQKVEEK